MKAVVQRVRRARVRVGDRVVGEIGPGLAILAAVEKGDGEAEVRKMADKCVNLRIFEDAEGKMNHSALDLGLEILAVSNFTVAARTRKGRRPSFDYAEKPPRAQELFEVFLEALRGYGLRVATGEFGAHMIVEIENDGPVTLILETGEHGNTR